MDFNSIAVASSWRVLVEDIPLSSAEKLFIVAIKAVRDGLPIQSPHDLSRVVKLPSNTQLTRRQMMSIWNLVCTMVVSLAEFCGDAARASKHLRRLITSDHELSDAELQLVEAVGAALGGSEDPFQAGAGLSQPEIIDVIAESIEGHEDRFAGRLTQPLGVEVAL